MPAPTVAIAPQDELLRLTGTAGDPTEDVTATGNGTGKFFGDNRTFNVRPLVASVSGTNPTLDVKIQVSADNVSYTDTGGITLAQLTASSAAATGSFTTAPALYTLNTPDGYPYVRCVKTIGGTASPTFVDFWLAIEPATGF